MDIKDLAGLSEPIKKLIEVVSNGIGALANPFLIRKTADAKSYEIRSLALAISDSQKLIGNIAYDNNGVILTSGEVAIGRSEKDSALTIYDRTSSRINHQQLKRQINLEQIISLAANELRNETSVSEEPLDDDWVSRFFNLAEDVNSEEMKILWAKILAGEVLKPKSYSLRTLELLKNISIEEAELFTKISQFALTSSGDTFIIQVEDLMEEFEINFSDILLLEELGLIMGSSGTISFKISGPKAVFLIGDTFLEYLNENMVEHKIPIYPFTRLGRELISLIPISLDIISYFQKIVPIFRANNVSLSYGNFSDYDNELIKHTELLDL